MKGDSVAEGRTQSLSSVGKPELNSKIGDISPESFQKSTFYS
jgi:peroxin-13